MRVLECEGLNEDKQSSRVVAEVLEVVCGSREAEFLQSSRRHRFHDMLKL